MPDVAVEASRRHLADMSAAERPWRALAETSDNIFSTWEWAQAWWRHFGSGHSLSITCMENEAGRPLALLPTYTERRNALRLTRFVGHTVADQLGPICAPGDSDTALQQITNAAGSDILLAERMPTERGWQNLQGQVLRDEPMPTIEVAQLGDWETFLASRSAKFRASVRRRARRLPQSGISFRLTEDASSIERDMDALIGLHSLRWDSQSHAFGGPRGAFHREFAGVALERGWLRLWIAEAGGRPVAASYGWRFGNVEYGYQLGRDPAWERSGVGAGMQEHAIRAAFADGMREFRLLRGDEQYKLRYATAVRRVLTIAIPRSTRGRGAVILAGSLASRPKGRAMLRRAL